VRSGRWLPDLGVVGVDIKRTHVHHTPARLFLSDGTDRELVMITAHGLRKRYRDKVAIDDLTFDVRPGVVTGFLGRTVPVSPRRCC
jgi:hypothetical protein